MVGAGTILNPAHFDAAVKAGSQFIVSPGTTRELIHAARGSDIPLLPGAATASEVMQLREEGYQILKFFPAEQAGGAAYLKSLSSPLAGTMFCPTGGISLKNARRTISRCRTSSVSADRGWRRRKWWSPATGPGSPKLAAEAACALAG